MILESMHHATKIDIELSRPFLSKAILDLHDNFNQLTFSKNIYAPSKFILFCNLIYDAFGQKHPKTIVNELPNAHVNSNGQKDILLGFSAGLDSVYQAILLKELGYAVHLFFARNINTYENGQSWKYAKAIADKLKLDMMEAVVKKNLRKDVELNPFRQSWPENPIKNQLILALMIDVCIEKNWPFISLGDDFDLDLAHSVAGVNTTDAREVTLSFLEGMKHYVDGIEFIPIPKMHDKGIRLQKLIEYGLQDDYYSCVQSGRFNKSLRNKMQKKFNVILFGNNCGCCRKCCMHDLILHYSGKKTFPEDFIAHCWEKMYMTGCGADYEFFKPDLPIDVRISNLFSY